MSAAESLLRESMEADVARPRPRSRPVLRSVSRAPGGPEPAVVRQNVATFTGFHALVTSLYGQSARLDEALARACRAAACLPVEMLDERLAMEWTALPISEEGSAVLLNLVAETGTRLRFDPTLGAAEALVAAYARFRRADETEALRNLIALGRECELLASAIRLLLVELESAQA